MADNKNPFENILNKLGEESQGLTAEEKTLARRLVAYEAQTKELDKKINQLSTQLEQVKRPIPMTGGTSNQWQTIEDSRKKRVVEIEKQLESTSKQQMSIVEKMAQIDIITEPGGYTEEHRIQSANENFIRSTRGLTKQERISSEVYKYTRPQYYETIQRAARQPSHLITERIRSREEEIQNLSTRLSEMAESGIEMIPGKIPEGLSKKERKQFRKEEKRKAELRQEYTSTANRFEQAIEELGISKAAEAEQKRLGVDLPSMKTSAITWGERVTRETLNKARAIEKIQSGAVGTPKQEREELVKLADRIRTLSETIQKLNTDYGDNAAAIEEHSKELKGLTSSYEEQKAVVKQQMKDSTSGGGGLGAKIAAGAGFIGDLAAIGAQVARTTTVQHTLADVQNRTAMAAISNQQFDDYTSAMRGDMGAFRRISTGVYESAGQRAITLGNRMAGTVVAEGLGNTAKAVEGAIGGGMSSFAKSLGNPYAATTGAIAGGAPYAGQAAIQSSDVARGISKFQTVQEAFRAYKDLEDTTYYVTDKSAGAYRGLLGNMLQSTSGAGRTRGELFAAGNNIDYRNRLADLGMSEAQMLQIQQVGTKSLGADFNSKMITRSAEIQRAGLMSAGEYTGGISQLNQIGGIGQMETVLKNAVAAGMDTSKNILQMIGAINNLSNQDALKGLTTAQASAELIGLGVSAPGVSNLPAAMRANIAANSANMISKSMSDSSMNWFNVREFAQLREQFPTATLAQLTRMQSLTPTELKGLSNKQNIEKLGLSTLLIDNETGNIRQERLKDISKISTITEIDKQTGIFATADQKARIAKAIGSKGGIESLKESKDEQDRIAYDQYASIISRSADVGSTANQLSGLLTGKKAPTAIDKPVVSKILEEKGLLKQNYETPLMYQSASNEWDQVLPQSVTGLSKQQRNTLEEAVSRGKSFGDLEKESPDTASAFGRIQRAIHGDISDQDVKNRYKDITDTAQKTKVGTAGAGGDVETVSRIAAEEMKSMQKIVNEGQKIFKDVYGGLKGFQEHIAAVNAVFDPKKFQQQASTAATELSMEAGKEFKDGVQGFKEAVDKLRDTLGMSKMPETKKSQKPADAEDLDAIEKNRKIKIDSSIIRYG